MQQIDMKRRALLKIGAAAVAAATVTRGEADDLVVPPGSQLALHGAPGTIQQEHYFSASPSKVWTALTDPSHLNNWFCIESAVTPGVGGTMWHSWGEPVVEAASILAWEPDARLTVRETIPHGAPWQPADGDSHIRTIDFKLTPVAGQTRLSLNYSGFGTSREWQLFQGNVAGCEAYQNAALGHYTQDHFGEQRTVVWARATSVKSFPEMWSLLTGADGILTEGSFEGLNTGDKYSIRTVTGDVFQGSVLSHIPNKQFAGTVENMNNSVIRIVLDRAAGPAEAGVWFASWGANPAANLMFQQRWTHALQKVVS